MLAVYVANLVSYILHWSIFLLTHIQCLSQDLETGYLKLAVFKGHHNILISQP